MRKIYPVLFLMATGLLFTGKAYSQISVTATSGTTGPTTYTTLNGAISAINAGTHHGAITISVTASTTETTQSGLVSSGTGSAAYTSILIKPAAGVTATISGTMPTNNAILQLLGADNVTIDGSNTAGGTTRNLTFNNQQGSPSAVIWIASASSSDGATNNTIKNCNISGLSSTTTGVGIYSGSSTFGSGAATGNSNNTIQNNAFSNTQSGVSVFGFSTSPYDASWTITGNTFSSLSNIGVNMQYASTFGISNNTITGMTVGINLFSSLSGGNIVGNNIGNINNAGVGGCAGIWLQATTTSSAVNVYDNYIHNVWATNGGTTSVIDISNGFGILISGGGGYNLYYNTILQANNQTTGYASGALGITSAVTAASSIDLRDNILVNTQTAGASNRGAIMSDASNSVFSTIDYNDYYATSTVLGFIGGAADNTIGAVQSAFGGNTHSISVNPTFTSASEPANLDLQHVSGNEALQAGIAITTPSITTDIHGTARSATHPVLGADEAYVPPVISYTSPTPSCGNNDIVLSGVTITDLFGVPTSGTLMPRIYFRKNAGAWFSAAGTLTSGTATSGTWSFTISASTLAGLVPGNVISYYVIAQNTIGTLTSNPSAGLVAGNVNTVTTAPTTPNSFSVSALPTTAGFSASSGTTCVGTPITLNSGAVTGVGTLTSYNWSGPNSYSTTTATSSTVLTPTTTASSGIYTLTVTYPGTGCVSANRNVTVTVNPTPSAITGTASVCPGTTTTLHDATAAGTWSSSTAGIGSIGVSTGIVTGVSAGTTTISYIVSGICVVTADVTVNPLPFGITGSTGVCVGQVTTLSDASASGTWSSNNISAASVNVSTGDVTGNSSGAATISYILPTGCFITRLETVNTNPTAVTGSLSICTGSSTTLGSTPAGGTWTSNDGTIASTSGSAVINGVAVGNTTVTYTVSTGCYITAPVTVNPSPAAITGSSNVCSGSTTALSDGTPTGVWTPNSGPIAFVNFSSGVVTGVSSGVVVISYTLPSGCRSTFSISGIIAPPAIGGTFSLCTGATTTLTDGSAGGTWISSTGSTATIGIGTGFVTAMSPGTTSITYTASTGCFQTVILTVNPVPVPSTGTLNVCIGSTTTLSNTTGGGTWVSSNVSVATVGSTTGIVSGLVAGTAIVSYRLATGCQATNIVTVNALPQTIGGTGIVCVGQTTLLTDITTGGTWTSGSGGVASVDVSGNVLGVGAGTANITYTLSTGCLKFKTVTVNLTPAAITGTMALCLGSSATLLDGTAGGTWSSSSTVATITSGAGLWTAVAGGNATITYKLATGCYNTATVTANTLPATITGSAGVCLGGTTTLSNTVTGGTWLSINPGIATIDAGGLVTGVALGTTTISYTLATGCAKTIIVTVNALPSAISGTLLVCQASATNLTSSPGSGTWSSSDNTIASASAIPGVINGIAAGTATITYSISTGCLTTAVVTVNPLPSPLTGAYTVCIGSATSLSTITTGGSWTSSNLPVATVDLSGNVTGVAAGQSTISYTLATGCARTALVTVNPLPPVMTGPSSVCLGSNITLATGGGGTWSSSDPTTATVGTGSGIVTGVNLGTANITFIIGTGCYRTKNVTVNPTPSPVTGPLGVCTAATITLSDPDPSGVWSSNLTTVATIGATSGTVLGISAGTSSISYTFSTGCRATVVITVSPSPAAIAGSASLCEGQVATLGDTQPGGTWTSTVPGVATIATTSGLLTAVSAGTSVITYNSAAGGCYATTVVTINVVPTGITGVPEICAGSAATFSDATGGGTWASSNNAVAITGTSTGLVTGMTAGTANITYKLSTGCLTSYLVTIDPLPAAIAGVATVCVGNTTTLNDPSPSGTWSTSNPSIANIDIFGVVTGISAGTATITYILPTNCFITKIVTVNQIPSAIGGVETVCTSQVTTLNNSVIGGVWSSGNLSIATVGSTSGIVTGGSVGTVPITYMLSSGCLTISTITVNQSPSSITGNSFACVNATSALADISPLGGTWSSANNLTATVDPVLGVVTGVAAGSVIISYTSPVNGCSALRTFTVQPLPTAFAGTPAVCVGLTSALTSAPAGGTWTSSNSTIASVSALGVVSGISNGIATISYSIATGCSRTVDVTVNQAPAAITGSSSVCIGATNTLTDAVTGGTWISNNPTVATVGYSTGIVTGNVIGTAVMTYTLLSGCKAWLTVTVQPLPAAIGGTAAVCQGLTTLLSNTTSGGTWSSSDGTIASIGSGSGIMAGITPGVVNITYTLLTTGCQRIKVATVNALPAVITGPGSVCVGATAALSSGTLGGNWTSSNTSVATVNIVSGVVTGVSNNTVTITYALATGCLTTTILTVNPSPSAITGTATVCVGATTVLSSATPGGTWSSSDPIIGTVDPTLGVVTGIAQGHAIITYTLSGTSCTAARNITVNALPQPVMGNLNVCEGLTTSLSDLTPGGTWTSGNTFVANASLLTGLVTGNNAGTVNIAYTLGSTGCSAAATVTVNPVPYGITGATNICIGLSGALSSLSAGGSWSSSNTLVATVGSITGIITGVAVGTSRITYLLPTGCLTSTIITVSALPVGITGVPEVCQGLTTTLADLSGAGVWSSSDFTVASITTAGLVTGITPGTTTISYTFFNGCARTLVVTVNVAPGTIVGDSSICRGASTTLTNSEPGGIWTSSNTTVATITSGAGLLSGVDPGVANISYTLPTGCKTHIVVTVNPLPSTISGATLLCAGSTTALGDAVIGGTWYSSFPAIAFVDIGTGLVTGNSPGTDTIRYTMPGGCATAILVTVNPAPPGITGDSTVCVGSASQLANATTGGTWNSSNAAIASIGLGSGILTGVSTGTAYVTYTLGAGCRIITSVTVNPSPAPIIGPNIVCTGSSINLTNAVSGGTWSADDVSVASVVSGTGVVTGIAGNIDTIRYTLIGGCFASFGITVNPTPPAIDPSLLQVCQGLTDTLTDLSPGGLWTSSDPTIAPVVPTPASNIVLGVTPGNVTITYTFPGSGCFTTGILTVNPTPDPITGNMTVCEGSTTLLSDASIGGSWSTSNPLVATIGSGTGIVTAYSHGITTATYQLPTGCISTALIAVNPSPAAITGAVDICAGSNTVMADVTPFGTWSSSNTARAVIGSSTGEVAGIAAGTSILTYTLVTTGCYVIQEVTINPVPPPVLGNPFLCIGSFTGLSNAAAPGGTWSSSNPFVATVDAAGNVSGINAGTTIVTYTLSSACYVSTPVTVEPVPAAITGTADVCEHATVTLGDPYFGGVWTSSTVSVATVGSGTGVVTGVLAGTVTITYSTPLAHCYVTTSLNVNPVPVPMVGIDSVCEASNATYFDGTSGGTWSASDITVATIGSATGVLSAVTPNTVTISYTISNGCSATKIVTIDPLAHAGTITGPVAVCVGTNITLANATAAPAGVWTSSDTTKATIDSAGGVVSGIASGTTIITFIATNNCSSDTTTAPMLVNPQPDAGTLSGNLSLCKDYTSTLSSTIPGGVWSSSDSAVATVAITGVVTAIVPGTATISYAVTNVCGTNVKSVIVTVNLVAPHTFITVHPDLTLCMHTMYQNFGTDSAQPAGLIYTWAADNAIVYATSPDKQNSLVNFPNSGVAIVKLITQIASTGCFVTDSFKVTVGDAEPDSPSVKYYAQELICTDNTANSYQWGYDDRGTLDSNLLFGQGYNQQALYLPVPDFTNRSYWVITRKNGCFQKTYYNTPTEVAPVVAGEFDINLFPNPADSRINIAITGDNIPSDISVKVTDMIGKDVSTIRLIDGKGSIDVNNMAAGVYSVMFISNGERIGAKNFVKR